MIKIWFNFILAIHFQFSRNPCIYEVKTLFLLICTLLFNHRECLEKLSGKEALLSHGASPLHRWNFRKYLVPVEKIILSDLPVFTSEQIAAIVV